ncbi:flagellar hook-basal body complex protein FliE [Ureibacillus sp. FSL K6-3587]|uniref:flagellar hook-basal body complex protein FliE n=1 Tax=Ureibacillus sp. FSL K6-3587 TaxID=2954681 RepID=UPI00315932AC
MAINAATFTTAVQSLSNRKEISNNQTPMEAQKSFANTLKEAIDKVNDYQVQSDTLTNKLIQGENVELHDVMIAAQKANITLNATVEIRNKVIEAYQEIMRMTV